MSEKNDVNICCCFLRVIDCGDTKEHKHICCVSPNLMKSLHQTNAHVKAYCLSEDFEACPYYPSKIEEGD